MRPVHHLALAAALAAGSGCALDATSQEPALESAKAEGSALAVRLQEIAAGAAGFSPGTEIALAVWNLDTGERAAWGGDVLHVSASSAKAV